MKKPVQWDLFKFTQCIIWKTAFPAHLFFLFWLIYFPSISLFGVSITQWMVFQFMLHSFIFYLLSVIKKPLLLASKLNFYCHNWVYILIPLNFTGILVLWMGEELVQPSQHYTGMELEPQFSTESWERFFNCVYFTQIFCFDLKACPCGRTCSTCSLNFELSLHLGANLGT